MRPMHSNQGKRGALGKLNSKRGGEIKNRTKESADGPGEKHPLA